MPFFSFMHLNSKQPTTSLDYAEFDRYEKIGQRLSFSSFLSKWMMSVHLTKGNAHLVLVLVGLLVGADLTGVTGLSSRAIAQTNLPPFSCSTDFYVSQAGALSEPSQLNAVTVNLANTPPFSLSNITTGGNSTPYNAIGYNQLDNYLYAVESDSTGSNSAHNVVRVGSNGSTEVVRTIPDAGSRPDGDPKNYVVGDVIVDNGIPYLYAATGDLKEFYRVNLDDPLAAAQSIGTPGINVSLVDFAFHPTNGKLYGIQSDTHNAPNRLLEITFATRPNGNLIASVQALTLSEPLVGNKFGAVFFDSHGTFYAYHNGDSGTNVNVPQANLYAIDTNTLTLTHLGEAANVNQNDGARCSAAPPPVGPPFSDEIASIDASIGGQVWDDTNFNGIQDAGEPGYDNVVVELFTTDGVVQGTQTTSGGGFYNFTNVTPDDYRLQFELPNNYIVSRQNRGNNDEIDSDVNRTTGKTARITVAAGNNIDNLDAGILLDTEGDTIPDVVDGTGDRDGDGIPNYQDVDPAGYFYDETTGEIIAGGLVSVSAPGGINLAHDGNATGYYQWLIDGTAGNYTMAVTPPPGYQLSSTCLEQATFDPTGGPNPTVIGNYEDVGNPGFLTGNECDPFHLSFDLADGDPFVINNNIPFKKIFDYGDAPDSYGTDAVDDSGEGVGASHNIISGIHLGATAPDAEDDASTPLDGSGDGSEDDGITLATLTEGDTSYTIPAGDIAATGTGTLHAWLDFDKSGTFEPGEYTSIGVTGGTPAGDLAWTGITAGAVGDTYARFRFTSDASISANTPGGAASDGEVEDYRIAVESAVTGFGNGPGPSCLTGDAVEIIRNGEFTSFSEWNVTSTGDDTANSWTKNGALDQYRWWQNNGTSTITQTGLSGWNVGTGTQGAALLDVHMFWADATNGPNVISAADPGVSVFTISIGGTTYATLTTVAGVTTPEDGVIQYFNGATGNLTTMTSSGPSDPVSYNGTITPNQWLIELPSSVLANGDLVITADSTAGGSGIHDDFVIDSISALTCVYDYSDAPANGGTAPGGSGTTAYGEATHILTGPQLGASITNETSAVEDADNASDNGITIPTLTENDTADVTIAIGDISASGDANLYGWIDFDGNGSFETDEFTSTTVSAGAAQTALTFSGYGTTMSAGTTYARFRLTSDTLTASDFATAASDGEVEDYQVTIAASSNPNVVLVKRITAINSDRTQNPNDSTALNAVVNDGTANSPDDESRWPANYLLGEINAGSVKPGDEIEYTVYFLNTGEDGAEDVRICDWIQPNQSVVTGLYGGNDIEFQLSEGAGSTTYNLTIANDASDRAQLTTVASVDASCNLPASPAPAPTNDVLVIDLTGTTGDPAGLTTILPGSTRPAGAPDNAFGFFRFTTKVDE